MWALIIFWPKGTNGGGPPSEIIPALCCFANLLRDKEIIQSRYIKKKKKKKKKKKLKSYYFNSLNQKFKNHQKNFKDLYKVIIVKKIAL